MKPSARIAASVVLGALVATCVPAATPDSPYERISARNVFALKDPPPPPVVTPPPVAAPAITLQGFATVLGKNQVLFKVAMPARPPQPAVEQGRIMSEGEREGEITVLEINQAEGFVKFDNHGTVEIRNMKDHAAKPSNLPPVGAVAAAQPAAVAHGLGAPTDAATGLPGAVNNPTAVAGSGLSSRAVSTQRSTSRERRATTPYGFAPTPAQSPPPPAGANWPPESQLSPDEQEALIAVQQELHKDDPNFPPVPGSYLPPNKANQQNTPAPRLK